MSYLPKRHFWEWFKRHNKEYLELRSKTKKEATYWVRELSAHLRAYFKFLEFSMSWHDEGTARLTITVQGKARYFKKVDAFVATAPEIPGWSIRSLEDPMPVDFLLEKEIENAGIHPGEFYFSFDSDEPEDRDITVYHPLCTDHNAHAFAQLAYGAVYNLLGERSFGLDIDRLEMVNLSYADPAAIYKLEELPVHIGLRRSSMMVGPNGTLLGGD